VSDRQAVDKGRRALTTASRLAVVIRGVGDVRR
jgi:hypothetical protein